MEQPLKLILHSIEKIMQILFKKVMILIAIKIIVFLKVVKKIRNLPKLRISKPLIHNQMKESIKDLNLGLIIS